MKLFDLLTQENKLALLNGEVIGFFPYIFVDSDAYYDKLQELCFGYYVYRSGYKSISPTYRRLIEMSNDNPTLVKSADEMLGNLIRAKYVEKWNRVYNVLLNSNYNPLDNYDFIDTKNANNSDTITYDTNVVDNGRSNTDESVTRSNNTADNIYAFNSETPVGDSTGEEISVERTIANADKNTTHNTQIKTGTEGRDIGINETNTRKGRDGIGAKLIQSELDMRSKQIFFDIVYKDIDSIATLKIYI